MTYWFGLGLAAKQPVQEVPAPASEPDPSDPERCAQCGCLLTRFRMKPMSMYFCCAQCQMDWNAHKSPYGSEPNW